MMSVRERYAYFIVHRMLRLEEGEHLTLNVDEDCLDEAHTLAHEAANTSQVAVTMVTIRQGRVDGVDEIEPDGGRSLKARREVLLHLAPFTPSRYDGAGELDAPTLARHRLLADPIFLDRRLSIPYAVAYIPTASWAEFVYGPGESVDRLYLDLADFMNMDDEIRDNLSLTTHRSLSMTAKRLEELDVERYSIVGEGIELTVYPASGAAPGPSSIALEGGRFFYPSLPCQDIAIPLDSRRGEGHIRSTRPFRFFDRLVEDVEMGIEGGRMKSFSGPDAQLVNSYINIDDQASALGELVLCEELTRAAGFRSAFGIPILDRMRTTGLVFGGASPERITLSDESKLEENGLNTSFARLEVPVGSRKMTVTAHTKDGRLVTVMEDGRFRI